MENSERRPRTFRARIAAHGLGRSFTPVVLGPRPTLPQLAAITPGVPCRTEPDLFFSDYEPDRVHAALRCGHCSLLLACRLYALRASEEWGVWGGVDMTAVETYCGTGRGYQLHVREGEAPCEPCRAAAAREEAAATDRRRRLADSRRRRLSAEHALGGSVRGYKLHRLLEEEACASCKEALKLDTAKRRAGKRKAAQRARTRSAPMVAARAPGASSGVQPIPAAN